ncbi:MAG: DUF2569 family protein [Burkholderiaceae bacterium]|nr:DUF2569 family protein [Burkholderiaceae bacterium]
MADFLTLDILIVLTFLAIIVACPTYALYGISRSRPSARPLPGIAHGVGGWLLLFVATIVLSIVMLILETLNLYQVLSSMGSWNVGLLCPTVVVVMLYIYCTYLIVWVRKPFIVKHIVVVLWVVGPIATLLLAFIAGTDINYSALIRSAIYATVWTAYFGLSKRVACTYGTPAVENILAMARKLAEAQAHVAKVKAEEAKKQKK